MNRLKQQNIEHSGPPVPLGKAYYNGTRRSVESILEQYAQRRTDLRYLEKYSYLPRESFLAVLTELGRLK